MQGMIRKRGTSFQALLKVRDTETGKYKQLSKTFAKKADATRWLNAQTLRYGGDRGAAFTMSVGALMDAWVDTCGQDWSPSTRRTTRYVMEHRIRPRWGDTPLAKVTPAALNAWYSDLRAEISPSTIRRIHGMLSAAFAEAVTLGWAPDNPASRARPPKLDRHEITPPAIEELITLLDVAQAHNPFLGAAFHVAASTGMRRGELCGLRWSDIDFDLGVLNLSRSVVLATDTKKHVEVKGTKTGHSRRIGLDEGTLDVLTEHRQRCLERAQSFGAVLVDDPYIFSNSASCDEPWRPDYLTSQFDSIRKKAGLSKVRLHDLRHYHATRLLTAGVDLTTVAGRLGHAGKGRTTLMVYAHFIENSDRAAAEIIGADLRRG